MAPGIGVSHERLWRATCLEVSLRPGPPRGDPGDRRTLCGGGRGAGLRHLPGGGRAAVVEHVSTPPTPAAGQADRDGRWLLCDACHDLAAQRRLSGWVRRARASHLHRATWLAQASPALRTDARAELAATLRTLLDRLDPGRRISL